MKNKKSIIAGVLATLLFSATAHASTIAVEADASAYFLEGYSVIVRNTFDNGVDLAVGTGKYELPEFILEADQPNYNAMKWKAESRSIQVARLGYRFSKPYTDGFAVDLIVLRQSWEVTSKTLGASTRFDTLGIGVSAGYYYHIGKAFYLYPIASFTSNEVSSGDASVQGNSYEVKNPILTYSVHAGYEF